MSFYCDYIFPVLNGKADPSVVVEARRTVIAKAHGAVLEIGFGTGKTLPYYKDKVSGLTIVEPSESMNSRAQRAIQRAQFQINVAVLAAEDLPFDVATFDTVVSTKTLCSVTDLEKSLNELHRVLKPNGRFLFLEHVISSNRRVASWQRRLNPIQKKIGCGCHLDRDIIKAIEENGFQFSSVQRLDGGRGQPGTKFTPVVYGDAFPTHTQP